jgi:hypothetical protein
MTERHGGTGERALAVAAWLRSAFWVFLFCVIHQTVQSVRVQNSGNRVPRFGGVFNILPFPRIRHNA